MKKALITILTVLTALLVFVSCTNSVDDYFDPPKPEPVTTKVWKVGSDEFATLQEAVDSIPKGSKVSYTTIELINTAKGPGAEINGEVADNLAIDFKGFNFEFTGDFGIKVTNGADVLITNTADKESTVSMENKAADLSLIMSDGASVGIEGFTTLNVENNQYVISAKEGADISIGESLDDSYVKLIGMIASANNASETVTDISLHYNTIAHLANIVLSSADGKTAKVTLRNERSEQNGVVEILGIEKTGSVAETKVYVYSEADASVIMNNDYSTVIENHSSNPEAVKVGFEIEYEKNGGALGGTYKIVYTESDGATLPTATETGNGYITRIHGDLLDLNDRFEGWFDNADFAGEPVTAIPAGQTGHKKFYAKWTTQSTVTLTTNGGGLKEGKDITSYYEGDGEVTLPVADDFETSNGTFGGWYTAADFSGDAVTSISATDTGNKTFYAKWTFDVTFHSNFGTETTTTQSFVYGIKQNLNANTFDRGNGWKFGGWATSNTGTSAYDDGEEASFEEATDLYAYWNQTAKYVGKVVEQSSDVYITPVFYSQPVTVDGYDVSYKFYYSNDDETFVQLGDTVAASAIDAGNGNTEGSTAKAINTALQTSMASNDEGKANSSSVIYYEIVDANGKYKTNDDAYAAFYMYIPGSNNHVEGVDVLNTTNYKAYGSTFSLDSILLGQLRRDGEEIKYNDAETEIVSDTSVPESITGWSRLTWVPDDKNNRGKIYTQLSAYSMGEELFQSGRLAAIGLKEYVGEDETLINCFYFSKNDYVSGWYLMDAVNAAEGLYDDWFIPSFGEIEQLRLSFGALKYDGDATSAKGYFAKAVFGADHFVLTGTDESTMIMTTSNSSNYVIRSSDHLGKVAIYWNIQGSGSDYAKDMFPAHNNLSGSSMVLVRTF